MKIPLHLLLAACAVASTGARAGIALVNAAPSVVTNWNEVAAATVNQPPDPAGTASEQRPIYAVDIATVQVAVYDAVMAIAGTHRPFAVTPKVATAGASQDAAAGEAAYRVLAGLFPGRRTAYQPAYDAFIAALPAGPATRSGLAVGAEVAAGVLAWRGADGRLSALPPYAPASAPGRYQGANPIGRNWPSIRPFALNSNDQFRASGPPALSSATDRADLDETRQLGGATSTTRTPGQTEIARFHAEPPSAFWPRNLRRLVAPGSSVAEQARLMAMIWVTHADATDACFDSKYHFDAWRPVSAIAFADAATGAAPAWAPLMPTPPHPEYPAAHGCVTGALATVLRGFYGSDELGFEFNSLASGQTHRYARVDELVDEVRLARIAGGMHFRTAVVDGDRLGSAVANWALTQKFQPRSGDAAAAGSAVEVVGRIPIRQACPAVDDELPDALARAWDEVAIPGTVQVEFGLVGRRIVDVTPLQGPKRYFRYVRRAVGGLDCNSGVTEPRIVRVDIRFIDIRDRRGDGAQAALALDDSAMR